MDNLPETCQRSSIKIPICLYRVQPHQLPPSPPPSCSVSLRTVLSTVASLTTNRTRKRTLSPLMVLNHAIETHPQDVFCDLLELGDDSPWYRTTAQFELLRGSVLLSSDFADTECDGDLAACNSDNPLTLCGVDHRGQRCEGSGVCDGYRCE
jgi:hypothetical protein